jgi:hypothetical protein
MPSSLNPGFSNNNNIIVVRSNGVGNQKLTDRSIDLDGDGIKEQISIVHVSGDATGTPSSPGGRIVETVTTPNGFRNTVVETIVESDGGVTTDNDVNEYTEGIN